MPETKTLLQTRVEDLTVGDSIKLNLGALTLCVAAAGSIVVGVVARNKIAAKLQERKALKAALNTNAKS